MCFVATRMDCTPTIPFMIISNIPPVGEAWINVESLEETFGSLKQVKEYIIVRINSLSRLSV